MRKRVPVKHEITVVPRRTWAGDVLFRAICSCGNYRSRLCVFPGYAEIAGNDHVRAMEEAARESA